MIARTSFLPRLFIVIGLTGGVSALAACGGHVVSLGNTGDSADKLSSIDPVAATTSINNSSGTASGACPAGYAHPNICCDSGDGVTSTCGSWLVDPFRACNSGWTTYPNATECCNLSNPTDCMDTPADAGAAVPPPPSPIGCGFVCPPGWWSPPSTVVPVASSSSSSSGGTTTVGTTDPTTGTGSAGGSSSGGSNTSGSSSGIVSGSGSSGSTIGYGGGQCCTMLGDGTTYCDGWSNAEPVATTCGYGGSGSSSSGGGVVDPGGPIILEDGGTYSDDAGNYSEDAGSACGCSCPSNEPDCVCDCPVEDAGSWDCDEDAGSSYPPGYDGGVTSLCGVCPSGWLQSSLDPLLCCQTTPDGVDECFSQATGSASGFSSTGSGSSSGSSTGVSGGSSSAGNSSSSSSGGVVSTPVEYPTDAGVSANGGN